MFIDNKTECVFDQQGLKGFRVFWQFDDMFGSSILLDYDIDGDYVFNKTETDTIYSEAFSNLKNFSYLYHINFNKEEYEIDHVDSFFVEYKGERLHYSFFIPCRILARDVKTTVEFSVYDDSYFIDVTTDIEAGVFVEGHEGIDADVVVQNKKQMDEMYGELRRTFITLKFKRNSSAP